MAMFWEVLKEVDITTRMKSKALCLEELITTDKDSSLEDQKPTISIQENIWLILMTPQLATTIVIITTDKEPNLKLQERCESI